MKIINRVALIGLPALFLSQGLAHAAATNAKALEACAAEIEAYFEKRQAADLSLKIDPSVINPKGQLARLTVFEMDAFDSSDRSVVGRFTCTVNDRAKVADLAVLPLTQPSAEVRGRG